MAIPFSLTGLLILACLLGSRMIAMGKISRISKQLSFKSTIYQDTTICRSIPGLTKSQIEICYRQPDTTSAAIEGLTLAVRECQHQLQGYRWNCSSLVTKARNPHTSAIFQQGFKETAFAHAITAAGVVIAVSKSCIQGNLMNCGCDPKRYRIKGMKSSETSSWKWGGCSHNVKYGIRFSKMFLDARESDGNMHSNINMHNNRVGRQLVSNNMQLKCKCHGMSGSCELKTCWRVVPDIKLVGKLLKDRYRSAVIVEPTNLASKNLRRVNKANQKRRKNRQRMREWTPRKNKDRRDLSTNLLFYQKSPNYCEANQNLDILGTSGRVCNSTKIAGPESCSLLCCGSGYNLLRHRRVERCKCEFRWCCTVECQTCTIDEWISVCK